MAKIVMETEEQQRSISSIMGFGDYRISFFKRAANDLMAIPYEGGSKNALIENFQNFEKATNTIAEIENAAIEQMKKVIEITAQMEEAAYQRGKVGEKTFQADIINKKNVSLADI